MKYIVTLLLLLCSLQLQAIEPQKPTILAFGDSNTWGWKSVAESEGSNGKFADHERWTGVMEQALGGNYKVVVSGLVGRTTDLDGRNVGAISAESFNGAGALPMAIARHNPLALVVIMLGTNDLQSGYNKTPREIARSAFSLARTVKGMNNALYSHYPAPQVLLITPAPLGDTSKTPLKSLFQSGEAPSKQLSAAFTAESLADENQDIWLMDAGKITTTDGADGIHLSQKNHKLLGMAIAKYIKSKSTAL
ncbi:GDSL-type esterase/lipase family protein [Pelagibaculum spongiae]|uniref:Hydrolase n=1 Tax=Pelagibaculum spongiae TaxID=2080658 RepID=A0A2V1H157_9GAMM|nr:GDSL-type esterase/lipase family protein [Pelagibaculum spongiae]PVZ72409.1 hydrolase [Pelagibaculum spongiae]